VNAAVDPSHGQPSPEDAALARIVSREAGLIVAQLQRRLGNFDIAEEAVQEAIVIALRTWRREGVPANPGGWLSLAARRRAIDLLRKRSAKCLLPMGGTPIPRQRRGLGIVPTTSGCQCYSVAAIRR
jgi:DNA-directed RNA polymerase specialized sigma24 family protein